MIENLQIPGKFLWINGNGRAYEIGENGVDPLPNHISEWRCRNIGQRYGIMTEINGKRWVAIIDWQPPENNQGFVVLFHLDGSFTKTVRAKPLKN